MSPVFYTVKKALLFFLVLFSIENLSAQIVGGHLNNETTPTTPEASTLSPGSFVGDVNIFNGSYSGSIALGSVSTPGGLSYSLSHVYSGNQSVGGVSEVCKGIPYGDSWQIELPTISVQTNEYHKYTENQESAENSPTFSTRPLNYSQSDGERENEIYWLNVTVNIPGVGSGRAVFKYVDQWDDGCAVFVLNKFETPLEIRYYGTNWQIITQEGLMYEFFTNQSVYNNASNRRVINYGKNVNESIQSQSNELFDVVYNGRYDNNAKDYSGAVQNVIEPKRATSIWYCNSITHRNIPHQGIRFDYEVYGGFNYFKEFLQFKMDYAFRIKLNNAALLYTHDYISYKDVYLKQVSSYVIETPVDVLELNYATDNKVIQAGGGRLINYNQAGAGRLDSLYSYKNILHQGKDVANFTNWARYKHQSTVQGSPRSSNPYVNSSNNTYHRQSITSTDAIPFDHSFLESPRITNTLDLIPGDIYEIRTKVVRPSGYHNIQGNGLLDIKIVTSTNQSFTPPMASGNVNEGHFNQHNGTEIFSTHNRALKWSVPNGKTSVETSNYFVMPNIPSSFGGASIQIGPANSDHNFSITGLIPDGINVDNIPNAYNTYHHMNQLNSQTPFSSSTLPHQFGVGMPWAMMLPIYQFVMSNQIPGLIDEQGKLKGTNNLFNFWANSDPNETQWANVPTKFDQTVKLNEVELIRYTKNPYMLTSVKQYKINGEHTGLISPLETDTSKVLVAYKKFEYDTHLDNLIENFNYVNGEQIIISPFYKQVKVYLSKVREMPINEQNALLVDTSLIPTIFLGYSDYSDIPLVYQDTLPIGSKIRVLTRFVDYLGGETNITYYPINSKASFTTPNYRSNHSSGNFIPQIAKRYGLDRAFQARPTVKEIVKFDEKNLDVTDPVLAHAKRWTYIYDTTARVGHTNHVISNLKHFRYRVNSRSYSQGFLKTTVYNPADENGNRSYTVYEHFGHKNDTLMDAIDVYLLFSKLKSSKTYNHNNRLEYEKWFEWDYSLAYTNGCDRPDFRKHFFYTEISISDNEYRDWYKNTPITYPDPFSGETLVGYEAQSFYTPKHFTASGRYVKKPRFMEFTFYEDLNSINSSHFFNSYFLKKVKETERTYENGLHKEMITDVDIARPIPAPPKDTPGITNPAFCDYALKSFISSSSTGNKQKLLEQKLCDSLLIQLVEEKKWKGNDKQEILVNQDGLSKEVWESIYKNIGQFKPQEIVAIVEKEPKISTSLQKITLKELRKKPHESVLLKILLANDLKDDMVDDLLSNAMFVPKNIMDTVLIKQGYFSDDNLIKIIHSHHISSSTKRKVLTQHHLTKDVYEQLIATPIKSDVEFVITNSINYPDDDILSVILTDNRYSPKMIESIILASPRDFRDEIHVLIQERLPKDFLKPFSDKGLLKYCGSPIKTQRRFIDQVTEYSYYEANERGKTLAPGYLDLFGFGDALNKQVSFNGVTFNVDSIQLKHAPSWQVYSVKTYSPQLKDAFNEEKYYYYYDLLNRYDRIWNLYDDDVVYPVVIQNHHLNDELDTIGIVSNWHTDYQSYILPNFDGMIKPRDFKLLTTPFQTTHLSKNQLDTFAISQSNYYFYDSRWFPDDFHAFNYLPFEGEYCPPVNEECTSSITECTPCELYKFIGDAQEIRDLPFGYCSYTSLGGNTYFCPANFDVTPWLGNPPYLNRCNYGEAPDDGGIVTRAQMPIQAISKTFHLRSTYQQVDTLRYENGQTGYIANQNELDDKNAFHRLKIDGNNTHIAEFWLGGTEDADENNRTPYKMILPFDAIRTNHVVKRNRYLQIELTENNVGIQTRFYYNRAQLNYHHNINCHLGLGTYTAYYNKDIGLPYRVTTGYGREDSLSTFYAYSPSGKLIQTTSPNDKSMYYSYDNYNRLHKVYEEDRLLSTTNYSYWNHDFDASFQERAQMNYVLSKVYNSLKSDHTETIKGFIDPLGRNYGTISAIHKLTEQIHSGLAVYDNLGRVIHAHKPIYLEYENPAMRYQSDLSNLFVTTEYESNAKNRVLKVFDYDVPQTSTKYSGINYFITNSIYALCELDLSNHEIDLFLGKKTPYTQNRYFRTASHDQDGNRVVQYDNAMGQRVATLQFSDANTKIVTLFFYDSQGNLTKTINANKQHTDYKYNLLGQLYLESTVDAGKKRYVYTKTGNVSAIQDEIGRLNKTENNEDAPYFRKFDYDDYGRLTAVKRVYYNPQHDAFKFETTHIHDGNDEPLQQNNGQYTYFNYSFSYGSTLDWLISYQVFEMRYFGGGQSPSKITLTGLPEGSGALEKRMVYGNNAENYNKGLLTETHSYDNTLPDVQPYPVQSVTLMYDSLERLQEEFIQFNSLGIHPTNESSQVNSRIYYREYNLRGSLLRKQVDSNADGVIDLSYVYQFDDWNRLTAVHAGLGNLSTLQETPLIANFKYDNALGLINQKNYFANLSANNTNIQTFNYNFDNRDRLTGISSYLMDYRLYYDQEQALTDAWGESVDHGKYHNGRINASYMRYNWDNTDMPQLAQMNGELIYGYTYDHLNRLTKADALVGDFVANQQSSNLHHLYAIGDVDYAYDLIGNITRINRVLPETYTENTLQLSSLLYNYQPRTNKLRRVNKTNEPNRNFAYDANGNMMSDTEKGIVSTEYGRAAYPFTLNTFKNSASITHSYLYSTDDLRIFKSSTTENGLDNMEYYLKDIGEYNYMTDTWVYYVSANERLAKLSNSTPNTYYAYDHLGNTRIAFSPEQRIGDTLIFNHIHFAADYYPYGKILRSFESSSSEEKYLTTQHERDRETGFDYRGARYFDSDIGRFLSLDPLASQYPAWSDYNYVMGNPISLIDPDGRSPQDWVKNKTTGEFKWDNNVTNKFNTPEGYEYIGDKDSDIIKSLFDKSYFEKTDWEVGLMASDEEKGTIGFYNGRIDTKLKVTLTPEVETKYDNNGKVKSKTFKGVNAFVSTVSYMYAAIPGGNPKYQLKDASLTVNGKIMNEYSCQGDCIREIGNMPSAYIAFSGRIMSASHIQNNFGKSYNMSFKFNGQYADNNGRIFSAMGVGGLVSTNRTYLDLVIPFSNK